MEISSVNFIHLLYTFMATDPNPYPDKTARHETISGLFSSVFTTKFTTSLFFCRSQRRQKNEDGIWIHVSLFCLDSG
jgi:uncharacterized membrane protein